MATLRDIKKISFLHWEATVEEPTCLYFYNAFTKWGAMRQAQHHIDTAGEQDDHLS